MPRSTPIVPLQSKIEAAFLLASVGVVAACGGGGGGGSSATFGAAAGADRTVAPYASVVLDGTVTGGAALWTQLSGPPVTILGGSSSPTLRFVAPEDPLELVFELRVVEAGVVRAGDEVTVTVAAPFGEVSGNVRARILVNGGGPNHARRAAFEAAAQRMFVLDADAASVRAYDVANPDVPIEAGSLPTPAPQPGFTAGPPIDVVAAGGVLAVVHEATSRQIPGRIVFYDPTTLAELASWSCGPGPIDADITADGTQVAVACAGDIGFGAAADPRGSVTWLQVPGGDPLAIDPLLHSRTFNFAGFDDRGAELLGFGVRLPRTNVDVSRDLEPRAVTFTPDGTEILVSLPANNAIARIATASLIVGDVRGLELADWTGAPGGTSALDGLRPVEFTVDRPSGTTAGGQVVPSLDFEGVVSVTPGIDPNQLEAELLTARGPVLPAQDVDADGEPERPFALTSAGPRLVRVRVDALTGEVTVLSETVLRGNSGAPLTSRANLQASAPGLARHDEEQVDLFGAALPLDPLGVYAGDAIRVGAEIWLAEQHRPSFVRMNASGGFVARYVPQGTNAPGTVLGVEQLPGTYIQRVLDGGFEGLAASADGQTIFAILGRPLDNPDSADDHASRTSRIVRVLAVARVTGAVVGEYVYVLERAGHVVRDLDLDADGRLVVLEEDPQRAACVFFRADLAGATNLSTLGAAYSAVNAALETTAPQGLGGLAAPVVPLAKSLALDLGEAGVHATAFLARGVDGEFPLLVRADAHGLLGTVLDTNTGRFTQPTAPGPPPGPLALSLFGARGAQFDGSADDEGSSFASRPVVGLRQALDLVAFEADGRVLVAGADGGLVRVIGGTPGYDETTRVGDVVLDTLVFPNAATLVRPDVLGPLRISRVDGDTDNDGLFDRLVAFGGRSVFLTDLASTSSGSFHVAWDSGDRLQRRVLARQADREWRLDAAAPNAGLEPRCLVLAEEGTQRRLIVACGGTGSLAVYDLAIPAAPRFVGFLPSGLDADPTDLVYVPGSVAPAGRGYLVAVDAIAGAVELIELGSGTP